MATLSERSDNWNANGIIARDFRHDHGDGYEETPYRRKKSKKRPQKRIGCSGNNYGPHVYVWDSSALIWDYPYGVPWYIDTSYNSTYEKKFCCGCGKRGKGFRRRMR